MAQREPNPNGTRPNEWMVLVDPAWSPTEAEPEAPVDKIMGSWPVDLHGETQRFRPNAAYHPTDPDSPLDPVDAVLRLLASGTDAAADYLVDVLGGVLLGIAVDDQGVAVVRPAPDGVPTVLVATAPGHRSRVDVPGWLGVSVRKLAESLPAQGMDVLLNPGGPASMRVKAEVIRAAAARS